MTEHVGLKLVIVGLQLTLVGTQIEQWVGLVYVGLLVSLLGFLVD